MKNLLIFILLSLLPLLSHSCTLLTQAFSSITNFHLPSNTPCFQIQYLNLSSHNLKGTLSWKLLKNLSSLRSLDLSNNSLQGSIPGAFFSPPSPPLLLLNLAFNQLGGPLQFPPTTSPSSSIQHLNLSHNRFTTPLGNISSFSNLRSLDLSYNNLSLVPPGLHTLHRLVHLDLSHNSMHGFFPKDFPITNTLKSLNFSFNHLTGEVNSSMIKRFGIWSFVNSSLLVDKEDKPKPSKSKRVHLHHKHVIIYGTSIGLGLLIVGLVCGALCCVVMSRGRKNKKGTWEEEERKVGGDHEEVSRWVGEARWGAAVIVFEKPLMKLTFADLAAATSGFSKEWQLGGYGGDGDERGRRRNGELYRAVLAGGEIEVVVRVMEGLRGVEEKEAEVVFREFAKLRHPNLLPLLGYCIPGTYTHFLDLVL